MACVFLQSDESENFTAIVVANWDAPCFLQFLEDVKLLPIGVCKYNGKVFEGQFQFVSASNLLHCYCSSQWFCWTIIEMYYQNSKMTTKMFMMIANVNYLLNLIQTWSQSTCLITDLHALSSMAGELFPYENWLLCTLCLTSMFIIRVSLNKIAFIDPWHAATSPNLPPT